MLVVMWRLGIVVLGIVRRVSRVEIRVILVFTVVLIRIIRIEAFSFRRVII